MQTYYISFFVLFYALYLRVLSSQPAIHIKLDNMQNAEQIHIMAIYILFSKTKKQDKSRFSYVCV